MSKAVGQFIRIDWETSTDVEYVRGHVTLEQARQAFEAEFGTGCGESVLAVKHRWARKVPSSHYSDYEWILNTYDEPSRGAFAVTELDMDTRKRRELERAAA